MKVIELFSGIGGMHLALKASGKPGEVVLAVDINPVANEIYKTNFPEVKLLNRNIQSLTPEFLNKHDADTILMSPPCQPFTRNGLKGDSEDPRSTPFLHLMRILPELEVTQILVENVKGFETSKMCNIFLETLKKCNFSYQEFLLSPTQFGVPNSRVRYYCLAKKSPKLFAFQTSILLSNLPNTIDNLPCFEIGSILEFQDSDKYSIPTNILEKYWKLIDICYPESRRSCCFTKAYGRYAEGTGSVFTTMDQLQCQQTFKDIEEKKKNNEDVTEKLESLKLRYFTPKEISRLQCFPESYILPDKFKDRQKYMVLGNSINIKVVSELIKFFD